MDRGDVLDSTFMSFAETIVAISTAPGLGAISIVRISGPAACQIVERLFVPGRQKNENARLKTHTATHGYLQHHKSKERLDEVVVTLFLGPNSYTGEDLIEISCHGSPVITRRVLALCIDLGARLAEPGEFTQRAFLSGKIDLTQAEAVLDLIQAKTGRQSKLALSALSGDLGRQIKEVRQKLMQLLTAVVAGIDFPEEVGDTPEQDIKAILSESTLRLQKLVDTALSGRFLRQGLRLAIVGRPNTGKSSLLNQLLKFDRAIVSDIPGTTRDSIEEPLDIEGIPVILVDTAGIRHTLDAVETIGIERTKRAVQDCHLVLLVTDVTCGWGAEEDSIFELLKERSWILVTNKVDLVVPFDAAKPHVKMGQNASPFAQLLISAKTGSGIEELSSTIERWASGGKEASEEGASLNDRQAALCEKALASLKLIEQTLAENMPQDCLASDLKLAIDSLSEICGELVSEEVIREVFANFCIGK
jgi:tRNA modification GTPase